MNWFNGKRQRYIAELLYVVRSVSRGNLIRKFDISQAQAAADLREFQKKYPGRMIYDPKRKIYFAVPTRGKSLRMELHGRFALYGEDVIKAWNELEAKKKL